MITTRLRLGLNSRTLFAATASVMLASAVSGQDTPTTEPIDPPTTEAQPLEPTTVQSAQPAPTPPAPTPPPAPAPAPTPPAPVPAPAPEPEPVAIEPIETPNLISTLDIETHNPSNISELFRRTPSVTVNGGHALAHQIHVYNIQEPLLNVTIDGAQQGNVFHHRRSTLVEPELLRQVEVIPGAGTALDGPGALAGAIRFETNNAFDLLACQVPTDCYGKAPIIDDKNPYEKSFGGWLKGTGFTNGEGGKGSGAVFGLINDNWSYLLAGSYIDRGDYTDGNGNRVADSAYSSESILAKISGRNDYGHSLDVSYSYTADETYGPYRLNVSPAWLIGIGRPPASVGLSSTNKGTRNTLSLSYDYDPEWNDAVALETNVFYNLSEFDLDRDPFGGPIPWNSESETIGLDIRNTSTIGQTRLTYGFDYQDRSALSSRSMIREEEDVYGIYGQAFIPLDEMFEISFGARYDNYDFTDVAGQNFQSDKLSPNAALTFSPTTDLSFTAGYYEAYRGVGIREAFLPVTRAANTEGESSAATKLSYLFDNGTMFSSGSVFRQDIENYLYPPGVASYDIENDGYEFELGFRKCGFETSLGVFNSDIETPGNLYLDDYGVVIAGRRWVADANYHFAHIGVTVGWTAEIREAVEEITPGGPFPYIAGKGHYTLHHLYGAWNIPSCEGLSATINVDNLFDEFYTDHAIYSGVYPSPGRDVRIGLNYKF